MNLQVIKAVASSCPELEYLAFQSFRMADDYYVEDNVLWPISMDLELDNQLGKLKKLRALNAWRPADHGIAFNALANNGKLEVRL